jgi:hypothetical protein
MLVLCKEFRSAWWLVSIFEAAAIGGTGLWIAHLFMFAKKVDLFARRSKGPNFERRATLRLFARVFAAAAFASAFPRFALADPTLIQCSCTNGKTTSGCCPSDSGNVCVCSDPQNPQIQCGEGSVYYGQC